VENEFSMKGHHNQTEVGIHISNKIGFRLKSVRRENEGHFISIKGTIHKEEISMKNICNKHVDANLHLKKFSIVPKRKIDSNTVIVEDLNTSLSPIDKSSRQKMKEETSHFGTQSSHNKFKNIEITPCITSDHSGIKLDHNNQRKNRNCSNTWRLNSTLLKE
jgi:hypothetical protein